MKQMRCTGCWAVVVAATLLATSAPAWGGEWRFGVFGGLTVARITRPEGCGMGDPRYCPDDPGCSRILEPYYSDPKNTVCDDCLWTSSAMHGSFGVVAEHPLGRHASLVFEPMYVGKGGRGHDQFFGWNYEGSGTIHSIDLPVFVKLGLDGGRICPYLLGGPALGLRIGSRAKSTVERSGQSRHAESDVRDTKLLELGLALGGGVELPIRQICLFIESQYTVGLTPLFGIGEYTHSRSRGVQIRTGLTFSAFGH